MALFADRLKELRKAKGQTQKQMGELLGLTERTYRQYEAGEVDPPSSKAAKLADYFGVSLDYLMGRQDFSVIDTDQITKVLAQSETDTMNKDTSGK